MERTRPHRPCTEPQDESDRDGLTWVVEYLIAARYTASGDATWFTLKRTDVDVLTGIERTSLDENMRYTLTQALGVVATHHKFQREHHMWENDATPYRARNAATGQIVHA